MKAICKANNINSFSCDKLRERLKKQFPMPDGEVDLEIGKEYFVYGIVFWDNSPWYYVCSKDQDEYPVPFDCEFFDLTDSRMSKHWKLSSRDSGEDKKEVSFLIEPWAKDEMFYEKLLGGDPEAVETFSLFRKKIEYEF